MTRPPKASAITSNRSRSDLRQRLVDHELQLKRRGECCDLQRDRQEQEPAAARPEDPRMRDQRNDSFIGAFALIGSKPSAARELQHDAGEVLGELVHAQRPHAEGRIVNGRGLAADRFEHHEMVEVPMQDGGQMHLAERADLRPAARASKSRADRRCPSGCAAMRRRARARSADASRSDRRCARSSGQIMAMQASPHSAASAARIAGADDEARD